MRRKIGGSPRFKTARFARFYMIKRKRFAAQFAKLKKIFGCVWSAGNKGVGGTQKDMPVSTILRRITPFALRLRHKEFGIIVMIITCID